MCVNPLGKIEGADLLVIEATFLTQDAELADRYGHLTVRQAAQVAAECGVRRLVLTHFFRRYADTGRYLDEAGEVFASDIVVAEDLARVPVPGGRDRMSTDDPRPAIHRSRRKTVH